MAEQLGRLAGLAVTPGAAAVRLALELAAAVAARLGGRHGVAAGYGAESAADMARVRTESGGGEAVRAGMLRVGVCRHRAAMLK